MRMVICPARPLAARAAMLLAVALAAPDPAAAGERLVFSAAPSELVEAAQDLVEAMANEEIPVGRIRAAVFDLNGDGIDEIFVLVTDAGCEGEACPVSVFSEMEGAYHQLLGPADAVPAEALRIGIGRHAGYGDLQSGDTVLGFDLDALHYLPIRNSGGD